MPILEDFKNIAEKITGIGRPRPKELSTLVRARKPHPFRFKDDGETPNNRAWPLVVYRSPIFLRDGYDPAAIFEDLFAKNGWKHAWRDGIYDFLHFHTRTHEVLGIARGTVLIQFGGARGRKINLKAGDVVVLPAGTGHCRIKASGELLVVGAYPSTPGKYDEPKPSEIEHERAFKAIAKVALPKSDLVYGEKGPLFKQWRRPCAGFYVKEPGPSTRIDRSTRRIIELSNIAGVTRFRRRLRTFRQLGTFTKSLPIFGRMRLATKKRPEIISGLFSLELKP